MSAPAARGQTGEWVWIGGSQSANAPQGPYPARGVPSATSLPGSRFEAASATDSAGNFWLFGGVVGNGSQVYFNDLWEFSPATKQWTWWGGGNTSMRGVYGNQGVEAAGNYPGGRTGPVLWTDHSGNIWLFGGYGADSSGTYGLLNDLWKFDVAAGDWTWMGGSSAFPTATNDPYVPCPAGVYGLQGSAAAGNAPGGRQGAIGWTGSDGNLWLFAGQGCDSAAQQGSLNQSQGSLNDLWKFDLASGQWTWISGVDAVNSVGQYGTLGFPSAGVPGGRSYAANMGSDSNGNFWLFGGIAAGSGSSAATAGYLNDLWEFNPATKQWTWQSGSQGIPLSSGKLVTSQPGSYGTLGQFAPSNVPGGRAADAGFIDGKGTLWLFGGESVDASGVPVVDDDLWAFDPALKQWAWMTGNEPDELPCVQYQNGSCSAYEASPSYGMEGVAATGNTPGSRHDGAGWTDSSGNLWLFGEGYDDLWEYLNPAATAPATLSFGTLSVSPSTVVVGAGQVVTISDTITYSSAQPSGMVQYVLNGSTYTATCTPSSSANGSPETCTAVVPAATIAGLATGSYPVTGGIAADSNYAAAIAQSGAFNVTPAAGSGSGCPVPASNSNTMAITYYTLAESDRDAFSFPDGVSSNYVLPALGGNGLPVYNTAATVISGQIAPPKDLLADDEITWWSPLLNNGGPGGTSDVIETGTAIVSLPFINKTFYPPNGTGSNDSQHGFQTAVLTGNLVAPASETVSFTIASDDMAFLYLDGQIACDDGGVHAATSVPCTTSTIAPGAHTLELFYADLNPTGAELDFSVTTSNVGVGATNQLVFGTLNLSPAAAEPQGTSQAITITGTITYSGPRPAGAVSFALNGNSYPATCTAAGASQETCSAVVPAATIAALSAGTYPVTGGFAGDCNYPAVTAPPATFMVTLQQATFGTMTFSPVDTVVLGTSQAITIGDSLSYPGPRPTGAVTYVLNGVSYTATCVPGPVPLATSAAVPGGGSETCSAGVPAATIAALSAQPYTVTGSFAGDNVYAPAMAASGTFTVTLPAPDFSLAAGTLTLVTQHHAPTTISVTPINGFTGFVDLSCGTLPAFVTCEWDPGKIAVSGGTASTQLTINTSAVFNYLSSTQAPRPRQSSGGGRFLLAGLVFPALLLLPRRRKAGLRLMLCVFVLFSMLKLSGCSGHYPDSTPPGTYGITITGTSGTLQHSTVLTLVVDQ